MSISEAVQTTIAQKNKTIVVLDIETAPASVYTFGLKQYGGYISPKMMIEPGRMIMFAARIYGGAMIFSSEFHNGKDAMLQAAYEILDEADIVVTYNGDNFDLKQINKELILAGYPRPRPYKSVDLIKTAKKHFMFESNSLDHISQRLEIGSKQETGGFELWRRCIEDNDPEAWNIMRDYCKNDVDLTKKLYDEFRPWITNHPPVNTESLDSCPACGIDHLTLNAVETGTYDTPKRSYPVYRCDNCFALLRGVPGKPISLFTTL
jgi:DNA polymerase elongation subunit (family B)